MPQTSQHNPKPTLPALMSAAVLSEPGKIAMVRVPTPQPQVGELLIRVERCGVCASNLARWEGKPWFTYPGEPGEMGHEGVGEIVSFGSPMEEFHAGQKVAFLSNHAYAQYDIAVASQVVPISDGYEDEGILGEPLGCAWNIFHRSQIGPGDKVAIIGAGYLGSMLIQFAAAVGAEVFAVTRRTYARNVATALGASKAWAGESLGQILGEITQLTSGRLCDVVVEATGKQEPLDLAAKLTTERGRLVIAGYHQDGPRQVDMQLWNWRGLDVINAHERDPEVYVNGMKQGIAAVREGVLEIAPLITHRLPLDELGKALELTRTRPDGFLKAIVIP